MDEKLKRIQFELQLEKPNGEILRRVLKDVINQTDDLLPFLQFLLDANPPDASKGDAAAFLQTKSRMLTILENSLHTRIKKSQSRRQSREASREPSPRSSFSGGAPQIIPSKSFDVSVDKKRNVPQVTLLHVDSTPNLQEKLKEAATHPLSLPVTPNRSEENMVSLGLNFSRRYLSHLAEDIRISNPLIQKKFFSGENLVNWLASSSECSTAKAIVISQQLLDSKLIFPIHPFAKLFREVDNCIYYFAEVESEPSSKAASPSSSMILPSALEQVEKSLRVFFQFSLFLEQVILRELLDFWVFLKKQGDLSSLSPETLTQTKEVVFHHYLSSDAPQKIHLEKRVFDDISSLSKEILLEIFQESQEILKKQFDKFLLSTVNVTFQTSKLTPLESFYIQIRLKKALRGKEKILTTRRLSKCFSGQILVNWILSHTFESNRENAIKLFQEMMDLEPPFLEKYAPKVAFLDSENEFFFFSKPKKPTSFSSKKKKQKRKKLTRMTSSESKRMILSNFAEYSQVTGIENPSSSAPSDYSALRSSIDGNAANFGDSFQFDKVVGNMNLGFTLRTKTDLKMSGVTHLSPDDSLEGPVAPSRKSSIGNGEDKVYLARAKLAAEIFNSSPSKSVNRLVAEGIIEKAEAIPIAKFLHSNEYLEKEKLGDFLGTNEPLMQQVLGAYIGELDFVDMDFDLALRLLLFCFRLPGEAQKIERILGVFSSHYCSQNPESVFASHEAAWALAYAIIMLNTDRHSPQVKKKMTKQQFIHNCRQINDGENFPPEYLGDIYDRIVLEAIRMKSDGALWPDALKCGWITAQKKKRKVTKGTISEKVSQKWKRWWCILLKNSILFLKKPGDIEPVATMSLEGAELASNVKSKDKKFVLEILTKDNEITDLAFFSERELTTWNRSITKLLTTKSKEEIKH